MLTEEAEVLYKTTDFYAPDCERCIAWNDPDLAIAWPLDGATPLLSDKDMKLPTLAQFESPFDYDGRPLQPLEDR